MTKTATGTFKIEWNEETTIAEHEDGTKMTKVLARRVYSGDIEGEGTVHYLMAYQPDKSVHFTGFEYITGSVLGKSGSVTTQETGIFAEGVASAVADSIASSATGNLKGMHVTHEYSLGHRDDLTYPYEIVIDTEK